MNTLVRNHPCLDGIVLGFIAAFAVVSFERQIIASWSVLLWIVLGVSVCLIALALEFPSTSDPNFHHATRQISHVEEKLWTKDLLLGFAYPLVGALVLVGLQKLIIESPLH